MLSTTLTAVIVVFCVFVFIPVALWWVRNVARVFFKYNISVLNDWLKTIFLVSWGVALVMIIILILIGTNVITT